MRCPRCDADNPEGMKFCIECAAPLARRCPQCDFANPPQAKFCGQCAAALSGPPPAPSPVSPQPPLLYTPGHLAEKILTSRSVLEGERKQVTVLFADLKGSMELLADRDPEEARAILDPVLERMMAAVHRYEGTVNQVMGDGIMALFGAPIAHEDHPETPDTEVFAIELRHRLAGMLSVRGEYPRGLALLGEAEARARQLDDGARLGRVLVMMASLRFTQGDLDGAMAAGQQALELAATLGDPALQVEASFQLGRAYFGMGDFSRAAEVLRWTVAAPARGTHGLRCYDEIVSGAWLARVLSELGAFAEGRRHGEEALRLAMEGGHPWAVIGAHGCLGYLHLAQGDLKAAVHVLDRGLTLARATGHRAWSMLIAGGLGEAYAHVGRLAEGRTLLEEACRDAIGTGALGAYGIHLRQLSAVDLLVGRVDEAWQHADQAFDLARQQKARGREALALFQLGAVHAHASPPDVQRAEVRYQEALTLAEPLRMRPLQAHCHLGLGTLYAMTGQRAQARAELSMASELYKAMDMTFWLPQVEAALVQVEER